MLRLHAATSVVADYNRIRNEKSPSRPGRHLGAKRPNAEVRPLTPPSPLRGSLRRSAIAGIDRE
jgi:hypothetical protein